MTGQPSTPALLVQPYRFTFRCESAVSFAAGMLTNHLRGAFGLIFRRMACDPACPGAEKCPRAQACPYARLFAPRLDGLGPADMADLPRPFVLRAPVVDALHLGPGRTFTVDLHLFDFSQPSLRYFVWAFSQLAKEGLGPQRARVSVDKVERLGSEGGPLSIVFDGNGIRPDAESVSLRLDLEPISQAINYLRLHFDTPTETVYDGKLLRTPYFPAIVARACDRIAALSRFYQGVQLGADFRGLRERAQAVQMLEANLREVDPMRRSSRTGVHHELGGYLGNADFAGDLAEFVPWLKAAWWTGIGKQTVWGHGAIRVVIPDPLKKIQ